MFDTSETIKPLFARIGTDFAVARRRNDAERQKALIALVVYLERAYPDDMLSLRKGGYNGRSCKTASRARQVR